MKTIKTITFFLLLCSANLFFAPAQEAKTEAQDPKLQKTVHRIQKSLERIRNRKFTRSIKTGVKSKKEIETFLKKSFKKEFDPRLFYYTTVYQEFKLLPEKTDLKEILLSLLTTQIGGFYDPKEKAFYLSESYTSFAEMIIAHELMHALQDCYLPLDILLYLEDLGYIKNSPIANDDINLARLSFIEGEAQFATTLYMAEDGKMTDPAFLLENANAEMFASQLQLSFTPPIITNQLLFPYTQGLSWITAQYEAYSWKGINAFSKRLPCSTEQIIHPEKYTANERPVFIHLEIPAPKDSLWMLDSQNSLGEFGCDQIIQTLTGDFVKGMRAAAGWGGDSVYILRNKDNHILIWYTVWDTPEDSAEFFKYFSDGLAKYYPRKEISTTDTDIAITGKRIISVEKKKQHIIYISAPDPTTYSLAKSWIKKPVIMNWDKHITYMKKKKGAPDETN